MTGEEELAISYLKQCVKDTENALHDISKLGLISEVMIAGRETAGSSCIDCYTLIGVQFLRVAVYKRVDEK